MDCALEMVIIEYNYYPQGAYKELLYNVIPINGVSISKV